DRAAAGFSEHHGPWPRSVTGPPSIATLARPRIGGRRVAAPPSPPAACLRRRWVRGFGIEPERTMLSPRGRARLPAPRSASTGSFYAVPWKKASGELLTILL